MFVFVIASGVVPAITGWHDHSDVQREVFVNVPTALKVAFYGAVATMLLIVAWLASIRVQNWERGLADNRRTNRKNVEKRAKSYRNGVWMQTLLRDPAAGLMHSLLYFGFVSLFIVTVLSEADHQLPDRFKFLHGQTYEAYSAGAEIAGLMFLAGIVWAISRRYVQRPYRIRIKTRPEDALILGTFLVIGLTGFFVEAARIAAEGKPGFEKWSFVGYGLANLVDTWSLHTLTITHRWLWGAHVVAFLAFLAILPTTKLRHMFTSPMNMYLKDRDRPKGAMKPMPNLLETELESFGAVTIEDFTWKQLMDTDACTVCGRCTSVCPAHATGKPLDPREIVLKVGEVMAATGDPVVSPPVGTDRDIAITADSVFERVSPEEVWACTSCKACDEICPVNIEILDKILDMRRYLTLMESDFPTELGNTFRSMENSGNAYGMNQGDRGDWASSLEGIDIVEPGGDFDHEYLYFVGCAGSFDDRNKKTSRALAKLAAARGNRLRDPRTERDVQRRPGPARRQRVHLPDARDAERRDVRRHGREEDHHAVPALLQRAEERLPAGRRQLRGHPPFAAPRRARARRAAVVVGCVPRRACHVPRLLLPRTAQRRVPRARRVVGSLAGIDLVEMPRNGTKGMCCGAGGARMWMEENTGKKVNTERSQEAIATGASRIAVACPFCYVMFDDGVKGEGKDEEVKVQDIAEILWEAIENGTNSPAPATGIFTPGI